MEVKVTAKVTVPCGAIAKHEILAAAIREVRDDLPPAAAVRAVIASTEKTVLDGEPVREYLVDVFYTPRGKRDEAVDLDEHLEALETPVFDPRDFNAEYA